MKLEFTGKVSGGILTVYNRKIFDGLIMGLEGKDVDIVISRKRKKRSSNQNRYYHGVIIPAIQLGMMETQGEWLSASEVHEFLKSNFNYKEVVIGSTGEIVRIPLTTTDKSTLEFEEFLDKIRTFSDTFLNVIIPLPNEQSTINYEHTA